MGANRTSRGRRPGRPLPPGRSLYTPGASGLRRTVEQRSAPLLAYLHQLPSLVPALVLGVLLVVGLAVGGPVGAASLVILAALLCWLAFVSWPRLGAGGRLGRLAVIALLLAMAVYQATR